MNEYVGRVGLARLLECSEGTTRNLEQRGAIAPEMVIGGRPIYSVAKAMALKAQRDAKRYRRSSGDAEPKAA